MCVPSPLGLGSWRQALELQNCWAPKKHSVCDPGTPSHASLCSSHRLCPVSSPKVLLALAGVQGTGGPALAHLASLKSPWGQGVGRGLGACSSFPLPGTPPRVACWKGVWVGRGEARNGGDSV